MGRGIKAGRKTKKRVLDLEPRKESAIDRETMVRDVKRQVADDVTEMILYQHNIDMLSVLFALRDEFKFGKDRLIRTLKKASEHADNMYHEKVSVDDMLDVLKEETGVTEADLTFSKEVEVIEV